jgi:hypothetical protein
MNSTRGSSVCDMLWSPATTYNPHTTKEHNWLWSRHAVVLTPYTRMHLQPCCLAISTS